jgi:hypothetical protein
MGKKTIKTPSIMIAWLSQIPSPRFSTIPAAGFF